MQKFKEIIFASHNKGKIAEIKEILFPLGIKVLSGEDLE
jgi:inosine/xanthosine triphosphate pyrophosphatase family protein